MRIKCYFVYCLLTFLSLIVLAISPAAQAQIGGVVSEVGDFTICSQGLQKSQIVQRCILKENPDGPGKPVIEEVNGNWNPFLPNPYYNHPTCYNKTPHLRPGDDPTKDDSSKSIHFKKEIKSRHVDKAETTAGQEFDANAEFIPIVEGIINPDGQEHAEGDEPYMAIFFTERQAITALKMSLKGGSTGERSAEYIMYTGFGKEVNPTKQCVLGSVFNIPLDGRDYEFKIADHTQPPIKADYVLIKRLVNATPKTLEINNLSFKGVSADKGEPPSGTGVKGKVSVTNRSNLTLSNARIYDITDGEAEDKKKLIATTDGNGNYISSDLSTLNGKRKFTIERDGFKSETQPFNLQKNKTLEKNFSLTFAGPNRVSGKVTDASGTAKPEVTVLAYRENALVDVAVTDKNGSYRFDLPGKGSYDIQPIANTSIENPKAAADKSTISFKNTSGESLQRNVKLTATSNSTFKLSLTTIARLYAGGQPIAPVDGAMVAIYKGETSAGTPITSSVIKKEPIDLAYGTYTLAISANEYATTTKTITVNSGEGESLQLDIIPLNNPCVKSPRPNVNEFWLCDDEAKQMNTNPEFKRKFDAIDAKVGELRQKYGYKDLPQRLIIYPSLEENAFFTTPNRMGGQCPLPLTDKFIQNERITFSTSFIKTRPAERLEDVVTHEMGHGKDFYDGNCKVTQYRSEQDDFVNLRNQAEFYAQEKLGVVGHLAFYKEFEDGRFDPGFAKDGHPEENPSETFASLFHLVHDHPLEYDAMTNPDSDDGIIISHDVARVFRGMVSIVIKPGNIR